MYEDLTADCSKCGKTFTGSTAAYILNQFNTDYVCHRCSSEITKELNGFYKGTKFKK
jgi:DNA-directed RNA polymerase subunit RPC12/RpoP